MGAVEGCEVSTGLSMESAMDLAERFWQSMLKGGDAGELLALGPEIPDVLYALTRVLEKQRNTFSFEALPLLRSVHDFVARNVELISDEDERNVLMARLAYRAWDVCRREARCSEMNVWAELCAGYVLEQEGVRAYLSLKAPERSEGLDSRFLSDPEAVLAACWRLGLEKNRAPATVGEEAMHAYAWLTEHPLQDSDENAYLSGELALTVAGSLGHLGRYRESGLWAGLAENWFRKTAMPDPWLAKVQFTRLVALSLRHVPGSVLETISPVLANLRKFGHVSDLGKCRLLEALSLKDVGRLKEAMTLLDSMRTDPTLRDDPLVFSLLLVNMGEISAGLGDMEEAHHFLSQASSWLAKADTAWAAANLRGVIGEILRDSGRLAEAAEAYGSAIEIYSRLQMSGYAAYYRLLRAEVLLLDGRGEEASPEIISAFPVLEREALVPDALAALALLRESLRRQKADPEALKALRLQIQKMREVEQ
jgi:tetratricopeptide (TPR) repeat protein